MEFGVGRIVVSREGVGSTDQRENEYIGCFKENVDLSICSTIRICFSYLDYGGHCQICAG